MKIIGKTQAEVDAAAQAAMNATAISGAQAYLLSTDWKAARAFETGEKIDTDTATKRAQARATITKLRGGS